MGKDRITLREKRNSTEDALLKVASLLTALTAGGTLIIARANHERNLATVAQINSTLDEVAGAAEYIDVRNAAAASTIQGDESKNGTISLSDYVGLAKLSMADGEYDKTLGYVNSAVHLVNPLSTGSTLASLHLKNKLRTTGAEIGTLKR